MILNELYFHRLFRDTFTINSAVLGWAKVYNDEITAISLTFLFNIQTFLIPTYTVMKFLLNLEYSRNGK